MIGAKRREVGGQKQTPHEKRSRDGDEDVSGIVEVLRQRFRQEAEHGADEYQEQVIGQRGEKGLETKRTRDLHIRLVGKWHQADCRRREQLFQGS